MDLRNILETIALIASVVGGAIAIWTYHKNSKIRRAEWLYSLYEKFYEDSHYKRIRKIIDYETPDFALLCQALEKEDPVDDLELLNDYLNFFEFIASLWKMKQLTLGEIRMVFEYYIDRLNDFDLIAQYVKTKGFENLSLLLSELRTTRGVR